MKKILLAVSLVLIHMASASPVKGLLAAQGCKYGSIDFVENIVEVEYIESTGTQYIDTGVAITGDDVLMELDMQRDASTKQYAPFMGLQGINSNDRFAFNNNGSYYIQFKAYDKTYQIIDWNFWPTRAVIGIKVKDGKYQCLVNGVVKSTNPVTPKDYNVSCWVFAGNGFPANDGKFIGKVYGARIALGGVLVLDFQPVSFTNKNGINEGAMYDRVSGKLFRNAGSGAFVVGPDLQ